VDEDAGLTGEETSEDISILPRDDRNHAPLLLLTSLPPVTASVLSDVLWALAPIWRLELSTLAAIADSHMS
jgi:hypothetical protein